MRQVFLSFVTAVLLFQVVLVVIGTTPDVAPRPGLAVAFLGLGVLMVFVVSPTVQRGAALDGTNASTLAASYRTRFFLRLAFAEAAALLGFVAFFVANVWWVYPASLVSTFIGFARLAPTKAHLAADQRELQARGCTLTVTRALRGLNP
ncbi:MAG TPA: hypothetical protein VHC63_13965 [Acidimicrobiales bacterium]|nr:hypothetical protein [Acidimicrobiales bacterium]